MTTRKQVPRLSRRPGAMSTSYGMELIVDLHDCDASTFNRPSLRRYFKELCRLIQMERADIHFWDDVGVPEDEQQTDPKTKGTSAVQFILTSTIVVHTLDLLQAVYVNIFSCKTFDPEQALEFTANWFGAKRHNHHVIERK